MKSILISLILISALIAQPCYAGDLLELGNGGAGVLCEETNASSELVFFDYFEAHEMLKDLSVLRSSIASQKKTTPNSELLQLKNALVKIISRFRMFDPKASIELLEEMNVFFDEDKTIYFQQDSLPRAFGRTTDLESAIEIPKNCVIKQIIVQYDENVSNGIKYIINKDYFDKLDLLNKTITLLHEFIYSWYISKGISGDSSKVRRLLYFMISIPSKYTYIDDYPDYLEVTKDYFTLYKDYINLSIKNQIPSISIFPSYHTNFLASNPRHYVTTMKLTPKPSFCPNGRLESFQTTIYKLADYNVSLSGNIQVHCDTGMIKSGELSLYDYIMQDISGLKKKCFKNLEFKSSGAIKTCI